MSGPAVVRQPALGEDLDGVTKALTDAFAQIRAAVQEELTVVVVIDDRDLMGQGAVADAAVAAGMLGLVRAFALEGTRPGWRVNALTHSGEEGLDEQIRSLAQSGLSGQLLRLGTAHLGRVSP